MGQNPEWIWIHKNEIVDSTDEYRFTKAWVRDELIKMSLKWIPMDYGFTLEKDLDIDWVGRVRSWIRWIQNEFTLD